MLIEMLFKNPVAFTVLIIPLLISISVHEWAHGFVAYKFGDDTPKIQGRLSLNPFAHLDPLGTLMLFVIGIGWAKPVEINPNNIHGKYKHMLVAFAGPFSNFTLAFIFSIVLYLIIKMSGMIGDLSLLLLDITDIIVKINLVLGIFNMLPLPPLDGSNIIRNLLPDNLAEIYFRVVPYGFPILLVLMFTGAIKYIFVAANYVQLYLLKFMALFFDPILKLVFKI